MSMTTTKTISVTTTWEDLRKGARQLEYEIDSKLVSLNKLGVGLGSQNTRYDVSYASSSSAIDKTAPLSPQTTFDSLTGELGSAIGKLTEINDQMTDFVHHSTQGAQLAQNPAVQHTLRRHRDILRDYAGEFTRARANIQAQLDRHELLVDTDTNPMSSNGLNNRRQDGYLKENEHIRSTDRLLDEQISIAMATKDRLGSQRMGLREVTKKLQMMAKRYPVIGGLMQKIQLKKRKDSVILAAVICLCLILFFLYVTRGGAE